MAYELHKISVLVVEDNIPMLNLTKSILQTFGVDKVYGAPNGEIGFQLFCDKRPDIVITDLAMAPINGLELTHQIRMDEKSPNKYTPIIMMTSFSEQSQVIDARDAGITEFLLKPFNARDMYRRISEIIERPRSFVESENFFGPDRRRLAKDDYDGSHKRVSDDASQDDFDIELVHSGRIQPKD